MCLVQVFLYVGLVLCYSNMFGILLHCRLLRSGRWDEAQVMLLHRTTIYPNEAQSWRRLSLVMYQMGHLDLANTARYTAFELGIGQGGYGGSQA